MSPLKTTLLAACLIALSSCATSGPAMRGTLPPPPVDLKSPLPQRAALAKGAKLSDVLTALLGDDQAIDVLTAEVMTWRKFWADFSADWEKR